MSITLLIEHFPHLALNLLQFGIILMYREIVLLLVGVWKMLVGPLLQHLELLLKVHTVIRPNLQMYILCHFKSTLTRCRMSSYHLPSTLLFARIYRSLSYSMLIPSNSLEKQKQRKTLVPFANSSSSQLYFSSVSRQNFYSISCGLELSVFW